MADLLPAARVSEIPPSLLQRAGAAFKAFRNPNPGLGTGGGPGPSGPRGLPAGEGDPFESAGAKPAPVPSDPPPGGRGADPFALSQWGPGHPFYADPQTAFAIYGRTWDFLAGINLDYTPKDREGLPYAMLRALADADYLLRYCVNTRLDQLCRLNWSIQKRDAKQSDKQHPEAADMERRWRIPGMRDSVFGRKPFDLAARPLYEDSLVCDSPAISKWATRGKGGDLGGVYRLRIHDGTLVHPLVDELGDIPEPPLKGYQFIIKGRPAYDITQDEMIWYPRNVRTNKQYGYSLVEQSLMLVNIALRRDTFMFEYFKSGNTADTYFHVPKEWTQEAIKQFIEDYDSRMADNLANRRKAQWLPEVTGQSVVETRGEALKTPFDEWRARGYCAIWSLPYGPFVASLGRAEGDNAQEESLQEGLLPFAQFYEGLWSLVLTVFFNRPDLCFKFDLKTHSDLVAQAEADAKNRDGKESTNEQRERSGLPAIPGGEKVMVKTGTGWMPLEEAAKATFDQPTGGPEIDPLTGAPKPRAGGREPGDKPGDKPGGDGEKGGGEDPDPAAVEKRRRSRFKAPHNPHLEPAIAGLTSKVHAVLREISGPAARHIAAKVPAPEAKAERSISDAEVNRIVAGVDLTPLLKIVDPTQHEMAHVGQANVRANIHGIRAQRSKMAGEDQGIVRADRRVLDYASKRSAEMVGMKRDADGNLVPNPRAEMRIDEGTREFLRGAIRQAVEKGMYPEELVEYIQTGDGSHAFSEYRARSIAEFELSQANEVATTAAWKESGVVRGKSSLLSEDHDTPDVCDDNADAGIIPLDQPFPSGHMHPPYHPGGCKCGVLAELMPEEDAEA